MDKAGEALRRLEENLLTAQQGSGPLLQRDYWAAIDGCETSPPELMELVARRFHDFAPPHLVRFRRLSGDAEALSVGDELEVHIQGAGNAQVRVLHRDPNSLTLGTLRGHPEAGRITFGAYPNAKGDVVFHIRSRARSGSWLQRLGFIAAGEPMQTTTWTDFVDRLAHTVGKGVKGVIHCETEETTEEADEDFTAPTFIARGG